MDVWSIKKFKIIMRLKVTVNKERKRERETGRDSKGKWNLSKMGQAVK